MDPYQNFKIKEYVYWSTYLHENQSYLGRCYVWCKRKDAFDLPDATPDEQIEVFEILRELEGNLIDIFGADMLNYAFLGNITHHLHGHIIPRYSKPIEFDNVTFVDDRWGKNYLTNPDFKISEVLVQKIKQTIIERLK